MSIKSTLKTLTTLVVLGGLGVGGWYAWQMLSGSVTPRESMPDMVQNIMLVAPTTHFVKFAQSILYRGAGWDVVWPDFLSLFVIGAVCFMIALYRFRKSVALG